MFQIHCPLGHTLEIGTEHLGQRLMCPLCEAVVHTSPPRPGEQPGAKYEVQCAQGHILRVKQKYLGKEIRCPSCQQLVSMKPGMMLTSNGTPLSVAKPDAFKKQGKPTQNAPASADPKSTPKRTSADSIRSSRIPPPPSVGNQNDTDDETPKAPAIVDDNDDHFSYDAPPPSAPKAATISSATVPDDDFEFEVVDTQFNMELKESGIESIRAKPPLKKLPKPAPSAPPVQVPPALPAVPTGLHNLSGSEMMKVNHAAREVSEPSAMTQFNCPNGHLLEVESKYQGMQIQCPMCQVIFAMPLG